MSSMGALVVDRQEGLNSMEGCKEGAGENQDETKDAAMRTECGPRQKCRE
jgi:hypothetical protein